jgi:hypothetical protein
MFSDVKDEPCLWVWKVQTDIGFMNKGLSALLSSCFILLSYYLLSLYGKR